MTETRIIRIGYDRFLVPNELSAADVDDIVAYFKKLTPCDQYGEPGARAEIEYSVTYRPDPEPSDGVEG